MILPLVLLGLSIVCRSISELQQHGKLRWMSNYIFGFWGKNSHDRKYKVGTNKILPAPNTWYYRFFKIKYKERFPLAATALVFLTDGMHMCQFLHHTLLSLSVALLTDINFFIVWGAVVFLHSLTYKLLQR